MEIPLDIAFLRRGLARERREADRDVRADGALAALGRSQLRHDAVLAAAADASTLACRDGCAWCCHFSVDVRAVEVFVILDHIERHFTPERRALLRAEITRNADRFAGEDDDARLTRTEPCPFLAGGRCSIYPVRPQTCRNYHATDVTGCRVSVEDPANLDIDPEFAPFVYQAGGAHVEAFNESLRIAGFDTQAYELNAAFAAAWADPEARRRFLDRSQPFRHLHGDDVPAEFSEVVENP